MFRLSFGMFFDVLARYCLAVDFCSDSCAPQPGDFEGVAPRNSDRPFAGILETDWQRDHGLLRKGGPDGPGDSARPLEMSRITGQATRQRTWADR